MIKGNSHSISKKAINLFNFFKFFAILLYSFCIFAVAASARSSQIYVEVVALFEGKAMVIIDGEQQLLREGQSGSKGVILEHANARRAVLIVNGVRRELTLGAVVRTARDVAEEASTNNRIHVYRDADGLFRKTGSINGYPVNFLVDTGASTVAMSETDARRLGINYKLKGIPITIETAAGSKPAYRVLLDKVTVDSVTLRNVDGVVITGDSPDYPLLGMSYLGRFAISNDGHIMVLEQKY